MLADQRKNVLVRMPRGLKRRLAEEVARRESNLNDVAVAVLAFALLQSRRLLPLVKLA